MLETTARLRGRALGRARSQAARTEAARQQARDLWSLVWPARQRGTPLQKIAMLLNGTGYVTRLGHAWTTSSVHALLRVMDSLPEPAPAPRRPPRQIETLILRWRTKPGRVGSVQRAPWQTRRGARSMSPAKPETAAPKPVVPPVAPSVAPPAPKANGPATRTLTNCGGTSPLILPDGSRMIGPGESVTLPREHWNQLRTNAGVRHWLEAGTLEVR